MVDAGAGVAGAEAVTAADRLMRPSAACEARAIEEKSMAKLFPLTLLARTLHKQSDLKRLA